MFKSEPADDVIRLVLLMEVTLADSSNPDASGTNVTLTVTVPPVLTNFNALLMKLRITYV